MIYADVTTSAVVDVVDRYRDRAPDPVFGDRWRVGAVVITIDAVTYAGGRVIAVAGVTDDGFRYRVVVDPAALAQPRTLADSIDRVRGHETGGVR